jgi:hypothetical protein|tara:strand:- start:721 stop:891 length:171 start_codon:yes stop_codon:yes gene_type:complete
MGRVKNRFKDFDYEYDEYNDDILLKEEKKKRRKQRKIKTALKTKNIQELMSYEDDY